MKCPNCDFESPPEMRFCGMCGASLTRTCSECQFVNPVTYRFCGMCGAPLLTEVTSRGASSARHAAQALSQARPAQSARPTLPGSAQPPAPEPVSTLLDGERRVATILFTDVKGSTELLEKMGTEAWVEVMNNMFQVLETEIYRYSGEVGQFRGDGLVAFFGAKAAHEDDPEHAVLAGLAIQAAMQPFAADLARKEGVELVVRVGINTGEIIVANVGDAQYSEDTAMGEALTVASRMEAAAEPGTVLVSESTYRLCRDQFEWTALGAIAVKGLSHPIPGYRPLKARRPSELDLEPDYESASTAASKEFGNYGFMQGMIGRKAEFQTLKKSVEDLYAGRGGIMMVTGVKGMGKSYLVNQVRLHFMRQNVLLAAAQKGSPEETSRPVRWLRGRCRSYGHLRPYSMWLDLMHEWLGTHPEDQASEVQAALRTQMELLQGGVDVEKDYPNLAIFLSTPVEESATERNRHVDAEGVKRQFFQTVREWLHRLTEQGPLVLSFADMQWADTTSIELMEYCLSLCDTQPILWILVFRQERESPIWEFEHRVETDYPHRLGHLNIPPLSKEENQEFIDQFLGPEALIGETRELIIKKSEGNPYFIKELIHALIAQGALVNDGDGKWRQSRPVTSLDLPDSLQSLLMARIDRLSAGERRVLQMAAVIGSVFWLNALQALAGPAIPVKQLQAELVALQRAGIIHERAMIDDLGMEYAFDSSLIREVAYESLLNSQRVTYHMRVAEYLEEIVFREGKRRYFNTLAHHYRLAGDIKKELFYTLQAADRAQSIYANAEAMRYYTRALELLQQMEQTLTGNGHQHYAILTQKFEALNGRRAVYFLEGNVEKGRQDARALLDLAREMEQDPTWLIDALLQQPGVANYDSRDELAAGIPLAQEALELAQKIGDKRREMNCLLTIASQYNLLNNPAWVEIGDRALALAREIGDRQYEAMILLGLGHAYVGRDELEKGMEYLNAALPICQSLDDKVAEMVLLRVLGAQYERSGDHFRRLAEYEEKRLNIAREIGDRLEEADSLMFCGQIRSINLGDLDGGLALLREADTILQAVSGRLFPLLRIAQVQINLGHLEDAQNTLEQAAPAVERNVFDLGRVGYKIVTILLYNALGGRTYLQRALSLAEEIFSMEENQLISRQYLMAAACEASAAYLSLSRLSTDAEEREVYSARALEESQKAVETYSRFGYVNIAECSCEEIFLRHSLALAANDRVSESIEAMETAYDEMMRKYEMIPTDSPFRRTYLDNIATHREIRAAHTANTMAKINNHGDIL